MKIINAFTLALFCVSPAFASAVDDNRRGVEAMNAGNYEEAIMRFSDAYRIEWDNAVVKNNLMVALNNSALEYEKKGDFDSAYDRMKKAYDIDPKSDRIRRNFASMLTNEAGRRYEAKNGRDIARLLKESLEYEDSRAYTHALLGQVYYDEDDYPLAKQQWEKALALDPSMEAIREDLDKLNKEMVRSEGFRDSGRYHFKVRYEGTEMWTVSQGVLNMLEDAAKNAGWKLGVFPKEQVTVIIYTQEQFKRILGRPDWTAGVYDGKIRLRKSDAEGDKTWLRQLIYHEYMHAFVYYIAGDDVPRWLNEGIAQCYENMPNKYSLTPEEKRIIKARLQNGVPSMDEVDRMFRSETSEADVTFAYAYSKAFVGYIIDKAWDANVRYMLEELQKGSDVNSAFDKIFFRNVDQMRADWLSSIKYDPTF